MRCGAESVDLRSGRRHPHRDDRQRRDEDPRAEADDQRLPSRARQLGEPDARAEREQGGGEQGRLQTSATSSTPSGREDDRAHEHGRQESEHEQGDDRRALRRTLADGRAGRAESAGRRRSTAPTIATIGASVETRVSFTTTAADRATGPAIWAVATT